jgi:hypothetical protein
MNPLALVGRVFLTVLGFLLLLSPERAMAGTGGREKGRTATYLFNSSYLLQAGTSYTLETTNLSAGADTVLHIQDADGRYLDGNDDCNLRNRACTGLRSWLFIPAASSPRSVQLIVRAYGEQSGGTATLLITPSSGSAQSIPISFTAGYKKWFYTFRNSSHFLTTQEQGGSTDTVLLVVSGNISRAISYDDDTGVGLMSWIHVNEDCTSGCLVVVGTYSPSTEGKTTFIWDEDIHVTDCDADGLSNALEAALGTATCDGDTDQDGLKDGEDTLGIDHESNLLRFPLYGSEPLIKDLFVEADWQECVPSNSSDFTCGDPSNPNRDQWRMPASEALTVAELYAPDVAVHIDTGVTNTDPATWFKYNDWGGAQRMSNKTGHKCEWLDSARAGYFHGARLEGWSGGQGYMPGSCFDSGLNARAFSHELGHNMNLSHGGGQSGSLDMNCKPNYKSIMSYALTYDGNTRFSRNAFSASSLNPTAMDELRGLGTTDPALLSHLKEGAFRYLVDDATGAVDWNRDGQFSPGLVRAAAPWGWGAGGCDIPTYQVDTAVAAYRSGNTLAWLERNGVPTLYWFTRRESDGMLEYRTATSFPESCGSTPSPTCKTNWTPAVGTAATTVPYSVAGKGTPTATAITTVSGNRYLVLIYKDSMNKLWYQLFNGVWGPVEYLSGSFGVTGDLAAIEGWDGTVYVYLVVGSGTSARLKVFMLDQNLTWWSSTAQQWTDGSFITPAYGISLTRGYIKYPGGGTMEAIIAAIPQAHPEGQIELAWKSHFQSYWTRMDDAQWGPSGKPVTKAAPGLAYVPFDRGSSLKDGRFHLAWNPPGLSPALMTQTEGNTLGSVSSRRLLWNQAPVYFWNMWQHSKGNLTLLYDLAYDRNLRAVNTFDWDGTRPELNFFPMADGIFNAELKDQDDYHVIRSNLRCALGKGSCL